jgi:hypothetical protein
LDLPSLSNLRPFSRDPFTYVGRTVFELGSFHLANRKKFDGLALHQKNFLEIDRLYSLLLSEQVSEHLCILTTKRSEEDCVILRISGELTRSIRQVISIVPY